MLSGFWGWTCGSLRAVVTSFLDMEHGGGRQSFSLLRIMRSNVGYSLDVLCFRGHTFEVPQREGQVLLLVHLFEGPAGTLSGEVLRVQDQQQPALQTGEDAAPRNRRRRGRNASEYSEQ